MQQPRLVSTTDRRSARWTASAAARAIVTCLVILVVESAVCGASASLPALLLYASARAIADPWLRVVAVAVAAAPAYVLFALCLVTVSAATTRLTGARSPGDADMRLADMDWRLMQWARYVAATYVVRLFAGPLFRGTPVWTLYLRMNGAKLGRRVFINSLYVSDHNLLDFGNDVVIGGEVHLSGHTVEGGFVKTGRVVLGDGVTVGLCSVIDIDVKVGPRAQIGALSFVPKHSRLEGDQVYVGIPVKPLHPPAIFGTK
jgi:acetyltransferase-like isoleucine patch superfamily enzyme